MTVKSAQLTLVSLALLAVSVVLITFISGRVWHFPLDYAAQEDVELAQLTVPPFFAILGSAAGYLKAPAKVSIAEDNKALLKLMLWAPSALFIVLFVLLTAIFHSANQPGSTATFSLDAYRLWLTIVLSLISLTVPALSAALLRTKSSR